jgi:uncharacterized membrane protein
VDPVAVRGSQWFLGDLFHYESGQWFGVPLGNFGGWVLVAGLVIAVDVAMARSDRPPRGTPMRPVPPGVILAGAVIAFNTVVALAIGAFAPAFASLGLFGGLGAGLATAGLRRRRRRARGQGGVPAGHLENR